MWDGDIKNIEEVAMYINAELSKGRTQKDIEINDFKVNERVIEKKLKRKGYKKINNQYVLHDNSNIPVINKEYDNSNTRVINKEYDNSNTSVIESEQKEILNKYDNSNTIVINKSINNKLLGLAKNYDKILRIIEQYDKQYDQKYDKEHDGIIIELPIESKKDFRTTIRVNNIIWEQFNAFAEGHKEFTKRDLLSMALKEYMNKYK